MIDKRLKNIEQIQQILKNLSHDTDPEVIHAKSNLIQAKLGQLKNKITVSNQGEKKEQKTKDKQFKGMSRKLRESQEKNFKLEQKLAQFQEFHRRKSLYYEKKIGGLFYETQKYQRLLKKKLAAQERVKECKKVIQQLEQKLRIYELTLAQNKGMSPQKDQEEIVQRVFARLKTFLQASQLADNTKQLQKMRDIIRRQSPNNCSSDPTKAPTEPDSQNKYQEEDDQADDDDKMSVIEDQLYNSDEEDDEQGEVEVEGEGKKETVVMEEEITEMEFLGQEEQSWLDWILNLTKK